jgi:hypothetical protein
MTKKPISPIGRSWNDAIQGVFTSEEIAVSKFYSYTRCHYDNCYKTIIEELGDIVKGVALIKDELR